MDESIPRAPGLSAALPYTRSLNFASLFHMIGDYVNVFVPTSAIATNAPGLVDKLVYGARPYSPSSDVVAMMCHMGIIFPPDKPKKNAPNFLRTCTSALQFGATDLTAEDYRRIEDDLKFHGVVVTVIATSPVDKYPSAAGHGITSQSAGGGDTFSVDIIDYYFVNEFVQFPQLSDDPTLCIQNSVKRAKRTVNEDSETAFSIDYEPTLFRQDLLDDFVISFLVDEETVNEFVLSLDDGRLLLVHAWDEGEERKEERVMETFEMASIIATEESFRIGPFESPPILRAMLIAKETPR
jgi:hypothetical protein